MMNPDGEVDLTIRPIRTFKPCSEIVLGEPQVCNLRAPEFYIVIFLARDEPLVLGGTKNYGSFLISAYSLDEALEYLAAHCVREGITSDTPERYREAIERGTMVVAVKPTTILDALHNYRSKR